MKTYSLQETAPLSSVQDGRPYPPTAQIAWQMGELIGYNLYAYLENKAMEEFALSTQEHLQALAVKMQLQRYRREHTSLKGLPASLMKEASNVRYLSTLKVYSAWLINGNEALLIV